METLQMRQGDLRGAGTERLPQRDEQHDDIIELPRDRNESGHKINR
jgi:hypothetical protein